MERIVEIFIDLAKIYSPTGKEEEIAQDCVNRLRSLGLKPLKDSYGNIITQVPGDQNKEALILNAHLDTVEPCKNVKPKITKDGWITSSGDTILGADDKAAVAAILEIVELCKENNFSQNCPLEIVFTREEESGTFGAANLDYSLLQAKRGYVFDAALPIGTMILASPFYSRIDIDIQGRSAHASCPESADNALTLSMEAFSKLKLGRVDEDTLVNFGIFNKSN